MRIGELAALTGVSVRALRYYEEQELLAAERGPGGRRRYPDDAVDRVRLIQRLYAAGLSSRTIRELLPRAADGEATPELLDRLSAERRRLDGRIDDLVSTRGALDEVIALATDSRRTGRRCPQH
ncbi:MULTISPECIES: MerR family transcriptional regulator [unclassified Streptomyces]|uniref:MerR family transcriptional regulator n=1 Tax=unclassified Streptomyces TaxID=2593676 RepID=UPI0004C11030|nr:MULTISPECIES: MerR family transcriptional regulator [unclassified Streptomyces]